MDRNISYTTTDSTPTPAGELLSPQSGVEDDAASFIEINIPLPSLPSSPPVATTPASPTSPTSPRSPFSKSLFPFRRRRSSTIPPTSPPTSPPRTSTRPLDPTARYEKRIELSMGAAGKGGRKRTSTIDAAIVPAIMVLRAELFTPGQGERDKKALEMKDRLEVIKDK